MRHVLPLYKGLRNFMNTLNRVQYVVKITAITSEEDTSGGFITQHRHRLGNRGHLYKPALFFLSIPAKPIPEYRFGQTLCQDVRLLCLSACLPGADVGIHLRIGTVATDVFFLSHVALFLCARRSGGFRWRGRWGWSEAYDSSGYWY